MCLSIYLYTYIRIYTYVYMYKYLRISLILVRRSLCVFFFPGKETCMCEYFCMYKYISVYVYIYYTCSNVSVVCVIHESFPFPHHFIFHIISFSISFYFPYRFIFHIFSFSISFYFRNILGYASRTKKLHALVWLVCCLNHVLLHVNVFQCSV